MPDLSNRAQIIREQREALQGKTPNSDTGIPKKPKTEFEKNLEIAREQVMGKNPEQEKNKNPLNQDFDVSAASWKAEGLSAEEAGKRQDLANKSYGGDISQVQMDAPDKSEQLWTPNEVYQNLMYKAGDNLMVGTGNLITGLGHRIDGAMNLIGAESLIGNPFS